MELTQTEREPAKGDCMKNDYSVSDKCVITQAEPDHPAGIYE